MIKENNSRSFIPIAEGYLKSGMVDEAIGVLKAGLQVYPKYLGARVSLGKAYLEKGLIKEALKEFEYVISLSPDNIYAQRKLISIYRNMGRIDEAIKGCDALLLFNPKDKEIISLHSELMKENNPPIHPLTKEGNYDVLTLESGANNDVPPLEKDGTGGYEPSVQEKQEHIIEEFSTETMGDLFIAQGEIEKGIDIYRRLLVRDPDNKSILEKIENYLHPGKVKTKENQINRLQNFLENVERNKRQA